MSSESRQILSHKETKTLQVYNWVAMTTIITLSLLFCFFKINDKIAAIIIIAIVITWFVYFAVHLRKKYGRSINAIIGICFLIICIEIFDALLVDTFTRFFIDCIIFIIGGIYLLNNKVQPLRFNEMALILFAPPSIIYFPSLKYADVAYRPLSFTLLISFIAVVVYVYSKRKILFYISTIAIISFLSYIAYPNFISYLDGQEQLPRVETDARLQLNIINLKGDTTNLAQMGNKIVVLDTWYVGCGVCFQKFPSFNEVSNRYARDTSLFIAALNIPLPDEMNSLESFNLVKKYAFNKFQAISNTDENKWRINGYPTILVFDKQHRLRYSGALNTDPTVVVNNIYSIIEKLKKEQ